MRDKITALIDGIYALYIILASNDIDLKRVKVVFEFEDIETFVRTERACAMELRGSTTAARTFAAPSATSFDPVRSAFQGNPFKIFGLAFQVRAPKQEYLPACNCMDCQQSRRNAERMFPRA